MSGKLWWYFHRVLVPSQDPDWDAKLRALKTAAERKGEEWTARRKVLRLPGQETLEVWVFSAAKTWKPEGAVPQGES